MRNPQQSTGDIVTGAEETSGSSVRRWWILFIPLLIFAAVFYWLAKNRGDSADAASAGFGESEDAPFSDEDDIEFTQPQVNGLTIFGVVHPGNNSVITSPFKGTVISANNVVLGNFVQQGELIAVLDSVDVRNEIKKAEIATREAEMEYQNLLSWDSSQEVAAALRELDVARQRFITAKRETILTEQLFEAGIIAANEIKDKQEKQKNSEYAVSTSLDSYNKALEEGDADRLSFSQRRFEIASDYQADLQESLAAREIRAPYDGILLPVDKVEELKAGQSVEAGSPLVSVGATDVLHIKTSVSEIDIGHLRMGQNVLIDAPVFGEESVTGEVISISKYTSNFLQSVSGDNNPDSQPPRIGVVVKVSAKELGIQDLVRMGMSVQITVPLEASAG